MHITAGLHAAAYGVTRHISVSRDTAAYLAALHISSGGDAALHRAALTHHVEPAADIHRRTVVHEPQLLPMALQHRRVLRQQLMPVVHHHIQGIVVRPRQGALRLLLLRRPLGLWGLPTKQIVQCHMEQIRQLRQQLHIRAGQPILPLAHRLIRQSQGIAQLFLGHARLFPQLCDAACQQILTHRVFAPFILPSMNKGKHACPRPSMVCSQHIKTRLKRQ